MNEITYIILHQDIKTEGYFSMEHVHIDSQNRINKSKPTFETDQIVRCLHSFPFTDDITVLRLHVENDVSFINDPLCIFVKNNLPKSILPKPIPHPTDQVYMIGATKAIFVATRDCWKEIEEDIEDKHTANEMNGILLKTIYNKCGKLPLMFCSIMTSNDILPKEFLKISKSLNIDKKGIYPTIQYSDNEPRRIYKIKNYPECLLEKIGLCVQREFTSFYLIHFLSILSVFYVVANKYVYELNDYNNEYAATLNWKEGTFITNKDYSDNSDIELLCEINEPHLMSRWGLPELCSVIGKNTNTIYYGLQHIEKLNHKVLSVKGVDFISSILKNTYMV